MFDLIDIIVAMALGGMIGALVTTLCFWKGYSDILKRVTKLEDGDANEN